MTKHFESKKDLEQQINELIRCPQFTPLSTHILIDHTTEQLGWVWRYSTMHDGKFGHFITIGFLENAIYSFHKYVENVEGISFTDAVYRAATQVLNKMEEYL